MPQSHQNEISSAPVPRRHRVLVIEDDADIARLVALHLADLDCEVVPAADGRKGLQIALAGRFDLVILDLGLPSLDGLEICRELRAAPFYTPILMLTARATDLDRVLGLESGSDDYLTKPFNVRELVARARAVLRRRDVLASHGNAENSALQFGALKIDVPTRHVTIAGRAVELTVREFELLLTFARHPGRVFTRCELLERVWGYTHSGYEHTVNTHINRLRSKIEPDPAHPRFILTSWGVGYQFAQPSVDGASNA